MRHDSFKAQFPGYELLPEKKTWCKWPLVWAGFAVLLVAVPWYLATQFAYDVPLPAMVGANKFTLPTLRQQAFTFSQKGDHQAATKSFADYFALGGREADVMAMYAYSLSELGRNEEAVKWSRRALATEPKSKAAQLIHDALEKK